MLIIDREKYVDKEVSKMLWGVPPQNILISFDDKPVQSLADHVKEHQKKARQKEHRICDSRER